MSERHARLSETTHPLGRLLPAVSEATPYTLRGAFAATMPGCAMPGMYLVTGGCLWISERHTSVQLGAGDVVLWPRASTHRIASDHGLLTRRDGGAHVGDDGAPNPPSGVHSPIAELHVVKLGATPLPSLPGLDTPLVLPRARQDRSIAGITQALMNELVSGPQPVDVVDALVRALWLKGLGERFQPRALDAGLVTAVQRAIDRPEAVISVTELARHAGLSRSRFCERFTQSFGEPPRQWLLRTRMQYARTLLQQHPLSVAQVAERLGYASESAFRKAYRRTLGHPARVRR